MTISIGTVVEGHGDVRAVPELLRRLGQALDPPISIAVRRPVRTPRSSLVKEDELERAVALAAAQAGPTGAVLVLIDAEDDCPATLGPELLERARNRLGATPVGVVLAKVEFEAWFLAAAASLGGRRGLVDPLFPPPDPEGVRDAKGWLSDRMEGTRRYSETLDQPALAAVFSLDEAMTSDSFAKCRREFERLIGLAEPIEA